MYLDFVCEPCIYGMDKDETHETLPVLFTLTCLYLAVTKLS